MKPTLNSLFLIVAIMVLAGCAPTEKQPSGSIKKSEVAEVNPIDHTPVTGIVTAIQPGKDGYTAKVKTTKQTDVFVTVSRVNLKDPNSYRSVNVGDTVSVIGEEWEMNNETHLKALELK